jgi:hypothetical protein
MKGQIKQRTTFHPWTGVNASVIVCLTEGKQQNFYNGIGPLLMVFTKSDVVFYQRFFCGHQFSWTTINATFWKQLKKVATNLNEKKFKVNLQTRQNDHIILEIKLPQFFIIDNQWCLSIKYLQSKKIKLCSVLNIIWNFFWTSIYIGYSHLTWTLTLLSPLKGKHLAVIPHPPLEVPIILRLSCLLTSSVMLCNLRNGINGVKKCQNFSRPPFLLILNSFHNYKQLIVRLTRFLKRLFKSIRNNLN